MLKTDENNKNRPKLLKIVERRVFTVLRKEEFPANSNHLKGSF